MRKETQARELALQALYQRDLVEGRSLEELRHYCAERGQPQVARLACELVEGCVDRQPVLDGIIRRTARNWELDRMATSDRNILRLGVYELLYRPDTPPKVAMNEAIELAKKYSTQDSPTFVNGVLDRIYTMHRTQIIEPDPERRADLHVHSNVSDGSVPPRELPALAAEASLAAIALTDHDSVDGVPAAREAGEKVGVVVVAGVELTAYAPASRQGREMEVHVAGLFLDTDSEELNGTLLDLREARVERVRRMVGKLEKMGIVVDSEEVLRRAENGAVGRGHLAQRLVEHGYCRDIREAFDSYLSEDALAYVPKKRLTPAEAIELVHAAGGAAVLCHPALLEDVEERIPGLVKAGLDAIEVHYPSHSAEDEALMMELAHRHDLLITGGSDFHGSLKPDIRIGQEAVSLVELHKLQERALSLA